MRLVEALVVSAALTLAIIGLLSGYFQVALPWTQYVMHPWFTSAWQ